mmetsp:Transcript_27312/g.63583  ORF Transcript_27312/g.63583 Transcript_27312/m.63583 type:complete len:275 (-) Transcript_27312:1049-1873(-)
MRWHHKGGHQREHVKHLLLLPVSVGVHFVAQGVANSHDATHLFEEKVQVIFDILEVSGDVRVDGLVLDQVSQDLHNRSDFALHPIKLHLASQKPLLNVFGDSGLLSRDETGKPSELRPIRRKDRRQLIDGYIQQSPQEPRGIPCSQHGVVSLNLAYHASKEVLLISVFLPLSVAKSHACRAQTWCQQRHRRDVCWHGARSWDVWGTLRWSGILRMASRVVVALVAVEATGFPLCHEADDGVKVGWTGRKTSEPAVLDLRHIKEVLSLDDFRNAP